MVDVFLTVQICLFVFALAGFVLVLVFWLQNTINPYVVGETVFETKELAVLQNALIGQVNHVKNNADAFLSCSLDQINTAIAAAPSRTVQQLVPLLNLVANASIGYAPIYKPDVPAIDLVNFQFGLGITEWSWLSGSFVQNSKNYAFMFYLLRYELACNSVLEQQNLKKGDATLYNIAGGVSIDGVWTVIPYTVVQGAYNWTSQTTSTFTADTSSTIGQTSRVTSCTYNSATAGVFEILCNWTDPNGMAFGMDITMTSTRQPYYIDNTGVAPFVGGAGTMYFSFTSLTTAGSITAGTTVYNNLTGTNGWNDRQLVQTAPCKLYAKALSTIARLAGGFGAYIWLNLHIGETQYMFSHLFKNNDQLKIQVGDKYTSSSLNTYNQTTAVFGQSSTIQILTVKTIDAVQFVTSMTIEVGGVTYIIDTTPFGDTISIDFTGNGHWSGSALLYLATDLKTSVGTAFVEQNNMQPLKEYSNTIVAQAGLPASDNDLFYNWQPTNVETVPSVFLILLMVLFGIGIILGFCWSIPAYVARRKQMKMGKSKSKSESK